MNYIFRVHLYLFAVDDQYRLLWGITNQGTPSLGLNEWKR